MRLFKFSAIIILLSSVLFSCTTPGTTVTSGNWVLNGELRGVSRGYAVSFTVSEIGYIGTGIDANQSMLKDFWKFDPSKNTWTQIANLGDSANTSNYHSKLDSFLRYRHSAAAFSINNKGYVGTGSAYNNSTTVYLNDLWEYDPSINSWSLKKPFPGDARSNAVGFSIKNFGYIATGLNEIGSEEDLWQYDPSNDSWTEKNNLLAKTSSATAFVINNVGYVCGGRNTGTQALSNDLFAYYPDSDKWVRKRKISNVSTENYDDGYDDIVRYGAVALTLNNKAYLTTGNNLSGSLLKTTWIYDPVTDLWTKNNITPFEGTARTYAIGLNFTTRAFIGTGNYGSSVLDDLWEWKPNEPYNAND